MVFKCKMCGGDIEIIENTHTGKCLYCKSVMTLPISDNEKIVNLYNRANDLRLSNEFDKAYGIYETILNLDNNQVEAHWGLILSKYGVEYVDDPITKTKIPTCHRTLTESILKDKDYEFILKNAYGETLELYEKEAKQINEIQKEIINISSKESPYDIFICYKETDVNNERTHDSVMAEDIYEALTKEGYKVFFARITLEDKIGSEYEPYIYSALSSSKVMLAVGTSVENFEAVWVKNEWSRYLEFMKKDKSKTLIPVYSKIDAYKLPEEFVYLQAVNMDKVGSMQDLIRGVKKILSEPKTTDDDMIKKVRAAMEEESSIGNNKYEVTEVKEKLPVWYYVFIIITTGMILFFKLISAIDGFVYNIYAENHIGIQDLSLTTIIIQIIISLLIFIAMIMKLKSRKTYIKANYLYFISLVLEVVTLIMALKYNAVVYLGWLSTAGLTFILYLVNPKWHLDASSKVIVDKNDKDKLQEKNKNIRENFTQKSKYVISLKWFIISALICIVIYVVATITNFNSSNENGRGESLNQIKIIADELNLRNETYIDNHHIIGKLYKDEVYTILDTIYTEYNDACYIWYQIKTSKGLLGYVCGSDKNFRYVETLLTEDGIAEQLKYSNKRNKSKLQIKIVSELASLLDDYNYYSSSLKIIPNGNIFTVLDTKENNGFWYKVKTSDGILGWINAESVYVYGINKSSESNKVDKSKKQVKISSDYLHIREYPVDTNNVLGNVLKDEIYTILDEEKQEYDEIIVEGTSSYNKKVEYIHYKIKTNSGITGWINAKRGDTTYASIIGG